MHFQKSRTLVFILSILSLVFLVSCTNTKTVDETFTVFFNVDGGSTINPKEVKKGNMVKKPDDPTKDQYVFDNWYTSASYSELFSFESMAILSNTTIYAKWSPSNDISHVVVFDVGSTVAWLELSVKNDTLVTKPETPLKDGFVFDGWYKDSNYAVAWNFATDKVSNDTTLYAKWSNQDPALLNLSYGAFLESMWATWDDIDALNASVEYKLSASNTWLPVDKALIRQVDGKGRVDLVGLKEGSYDISIKTSQNILLTQNNLHTNAHDRSGYAHFNYTQGIGGYKDDGTLKDDAIVVYVTEQNKNMIKIDGLPQTGLGWILNNAQYTKQGSSTYGQYANNETLAAFNKPLVFRILGKVTVPEGATGYDSLINGGSEGDNGNMVRIKDANHITIEGIGEDAEIYGWGIHFMASVTGRGEGFHVRNLTFRHYPEDAIGMEGVQTGSTLTAPVSRGWIHHVTFFEGYSANPAESDKAEGDGSLDIKRGQYFTLSYNQFRGAHKTNLVGASDSNMQYHITFHHNWWQNNASRIPLARQANIHMYNNVFEITDDNQNETSYAQNTRANAYIFSEANYFYGTKNPGDVRSGAIKSYQDVFYSTFGEHGATLVDSRNQSVTSGNQFENFDTNADVFYYANGKTKVKHLTDAVTARAEVTMYSGHYRIWDTPNVDDHKITDIKPTLIDESLSVTSNSKITKGQPLLVFSIDVDAQFEMTAGSGNVAPALATIHGVYLVVGTGKVTLAPGTYVIESRQAHGASKGTSQAKDSNVLNYAITLDSGAASEARIKNAQEKIALIPANISYTDAIKRILDEALEAVNNLKDTESKRVDIGKLTNAQKTFNQAGKTLIEALIEDIGTVTQSSLSKISSARSAYDKADKAIKDLVTNLSVLTQAEETFKSYEVQSIIDLIDTLTPVTNHLNDKTIIEDLLNDYKFAEVQYQTLDDQKKTQITNYLKVSEGIIQLQKMIMPFEVKDFLDTLVIEQITTTNAANLIKYYDMFKLFDENQLQLLEKTYIDKMDEAWHVYTQLKEQTVTQLYYFTNANPNINPYFNASKGASQAAGFDVKPSVMIDDITITRGLKVESATTLTFTTTSSTARFYAVLGNTNAIKINDTVYQPENGIIDIILTGSGLYTITRAQAEGRIVYIHITEGVN